MKTGLISRSDSQKSRIQYIVKQKKGFTVEWSDLALFMDFRKPKHFHFQFSNSKFIGTLKITFFYIFIFENTFILQQRKIAKR